MDSIYKMKTVGIEDKKLTLQEKSCDKSKAGFRIKKTAIPVMSILMVLTAISFMISFTIGRYNISLPLLINVFLSRISGVSGDWAPAVSTVIFDIRLPRILAALLIGGAMAMSGSSYQGLFKNPMVSPDILGASAGAGFGAAMAILFSLGTAGIQISAFIFGLGAVALTLTIGKAISKGGGITLVLVLTGMVVSTLFSSFISITKYVADPDSKLPAITFWLMGGLSSVTSKDVLLLSILLVAGSSPLMLIRWKLNVLSFGDEEAQALGVDTKRLRLLTITCSTLLTAACVSICGMVGWIGLVIPHMARLLVGPNFKILMPASALMGAVFLLAVDDVARCAFTVEIPLGILTALIGAPFFLYLLMKGKKGWI
jgi:iron complex transport system permease protein